MDRPSSIFFFFLSVAICLASLQLRAGSFEAPGPMVFPLLLGLCLLLLSIILFVQSGPTSPANLSEVLSPGELVSVIYFMGIFFLCVFIFEPMGFVTSIFVLIVLLLKVIGDKKTVSALLYGLTMTLSVYLIFVKILGVRLPKGVLGF